MTETLFRRARVTDAPAIAVLETLCSPEAWSAAEITKTLDQKTTWAWTSPDSYLLSTVTQDTAEILILGVNPTARRCGLGRAIVAHAMKNWQEQGVSQAHLEVRAANKPARALYEALGWTEYGQRLRYYPGGEHAITYGYTFGKTALTRVES